jgi:transposase InsO family protein
MAIAELRPCFGRQGGGLALRQWIASLGAKTTYIKPDNPWKNGYCESFNGKLRDELPNGKIFYTLKEAKTVIEAWPAAALATFGILQRPCMASDLLAFL